jgi:hypothetical protein
MSHFGGGGGAQTVPGLWDDSSCYDKRTSTTLRADLPGCYVLCSGFRPFVEIVMPSPLDWFRPRGWPARIPQFPAVSQITLSSFQPCSACSEDDCLRAFWSEILLQSLNIFYVPTVCSYFVKA